MMTSIFPSHFLAGIDFGAVGGSLLMIDMLLFAILAATWEAAGRCGLFARKRYRGER